MIATIEMIFLFQLNIFFTLCEAGAVLHVAPDARPIVPRVGLSFGEVRSVNPDSALYANFADAAPDSSVRAFFFVSGLYNDTPMLYVSHLKKVFIIKIYAICKGRRYEREEH